MIIAMIWGLIVGNLFQYQMSFDKCKKVDFKNELCKEFKKEEK